MSSIDIRQDAAADDADANANGSVINPLHWSVRSRLSSRCRKIYMKNLTCQPRPDQMSYDEFNAQLDQFTAFSTIGGMSSSSNIPRVRRCLLLHVDVVNPPGHVTIQLYYPDDEDKEGSRADRANALYVHFGGGGFVVGGLLDYDPFCHKICDTVPCIVANVGYRTAPEFKHPVPLLDSMAALHFLYTHADDYQLDRERIAVGGIFSGACIAATLAQMSVHMDLFVQHDAEESRRMAVRCGFPDVARREDRGAESGETGASIEEAEGAEETEGTERAERAERDDAEEADTADKISPQQRNDGPGSNDSTKPETWSFLKMDPPLLIPPLCLQILITPMLDTRFIPIVPPVTEEQVVAMRSPYPSHRLNAFAPILPTSLLSWLYNLWLPPCVRSGERQDWLSSPLSVPAQVYEGLPRAAIYAAEIDPLESEARQYYENLRHAGVRAKMEVYSGMFHSFVMFDEMLVEARNCLFYCAVSLSRAF